MLSRSEDRFVREQLQYFECTEREAEIYLQALENGPSSIQDLSRKTAINRITVHSACAQLLKKGLLYETRKGKRRQLVAAEPDELFRLAKIKQSELEQMEQNLAYAVGLLRREYSVSSARPSVRFHEGTEGFKRMLEMSLSARGDFLGLIDVELFAKLLSEEYLRDFFKRRAELGIHSRLIWHGEGKFISSALEKKAEYRISVKKLPSGKDWRSGFISWNHCISLLSFSAGQITCTIIENEDIVSFYRDYIFEAMWQLGKAE